MKHSTLIFFLIFGTGVYSQSQALLDVNDVSVNFLSNGVVGHNPSNSTAGFEVPKGAGVHVLYVAAPWFGGIDAMGQLHTAGEQYGQSGIGFWPGPLGTNASISAATSASWDRVFEITRAEVNAFIAGGPITTAINDWPAHGDVSLGQDYNLAPFVDLDNDGSYDPGQGDYPCFPGDQALYYIFNDRVNGAGTGFEFRVMVYAYATSDPALDQSIFMHYTIKNQSLISLSDTYFGFFADFDLGNSQDDYIGSDVQRSLMYVYNGDPNDESTTTPGYGLQPPAFGITMLQGPNQDADGLDNPLANSVQDAFDSLGIVYPASGVGFSDGVVDNERIGFSSFQYFNNSGGATGGPQSAVQFYNYLQNRWADNSPVFYGGTGHYQSGGADTTQPASFMFPDASDPLGFTTEGNVQTAWNEFGLGNFPGDRRGIGSTGPFTMNPDEYVGIDFAFIFARASSGGPLGSLAALQTRTDSIRDFFFNNGLYSGPVGGGCAEIGPVGISAVNAVEEKVTVYPIPATDMITVTMTRSNTAKGSVTIFDLTGKVVIAQNLDGASTSISIANLENGVYLLSFPTNEGTAVHRFVKQ